MGQHLDDQGADDETAAECVNQDVQGVDLLAGGRRSPTVRSGGPVCFEPVALADEEQLVPLSKHPDVSTEVVRMSKVTSKKSNVRAGDTPIQHLSKSVIHSAANVEAALMTGRLKYTTIHAPVLVRE